MLSSTSHIMKENRKPQKQVAKEYIVKYSDKDGFEMDVIPMKGNIFQYLDPK